MRTRIYLVRHGLTEWNGDNRFQGNTDVPLTQAGIQQANLVAARLKNYNIGAIVSSNLSRAKETAKALSKMINLDFEINNGLREICFGSWEGLTLKEVSNLYGEEFILWKSSPSKAVIPAEGSLKIAAERGLNALMEIIDIHQGKNIAVFSHAAIIKAIILEALQLDLDIYKKFFLSNASISILDYKEDGEFVLSLLNDTTHLEINNTDY